MTMRKKRLFLLLLLVSSAAILLCIEEMRRKPALPFDDRFVESKEPLPPYPGAERVHGLPGALLWTANKGRSVTDATGNFVFPGEVTRVWIDVGANMLQTTRQELFSSNDLGVIAVEPIPHCWSRWPKMERLIALPIALSDMEGLQTFYISRSDLWSSLSRSVPNAIFAQDRKVQEELPVEVFHLKRILEMIPDHLPIELLKVDVQGKDLEVLRSGGNHLARIQRIKTEVNLTALYEGDRGDLPNPEQPFTEFLAEYGFTLRDRREMYYFENAEAKASKFYVDVEYENQTLIKKSAASSPPEPGHLPDPL